MFGQAPTLSLQHCRFRFKVLRFRPFTNQSQLMPVGRHSFVFRAGLIAFLTLLAAGASHSAEPSVGRPEKGRVEIGTAGSGTTSLPLFVALDGGYFAKRGLNVTVNQVGATVAVQGLISGTIDIYQGGTAAIAANLAGADILYVAAAVDRNSLVLFGQRGITSFEQFRGRSIATTFPGAFGEIAARMTARKFAMDLGKDLKLLYHRSPPEALSTFLMGIRTVLSSRHLRPS